MQVNRISYAPNFGRAFTTQEKEDYKNLLNESRKALSLKDTSGIVFDFNVPSENGFNTGIGTSFSDSMQGFTSFLKDMTGLTSVQMGPQGKITRTNTSPYSGTNYSFGDHIIDLKKLTKKEYAELLTDKDIKKAADTYFGDKQTLEYRTDYDNVIGTDCVKGVHEKLLRKAYTNFGFSLSVYDRDAYKLNDELEQFKEKNKSWLEPETIFTALTEEYGTDDYNEWYDEDRDLYTDFVSEEQRQERINQIKENYKDLIDFEVFKQFLADKQQRESKKELNNHGIKVYGDCLLGFSKSEIWANKDCFNDNLFYGGPDPNCEDTNYIQTWGLNSLDYNQLGEVGENNDISKLGKSGKMLYDKYHRFFERYDGLRMDAAWQFVTPFVYEENDGNYKEVPQPEINDNILNIMNTAAKDVLGDKFNPERPNNIMLELVGLSAGKSRDLTKNIYPHLYTTAYAEYDENPAKFKQNGYKNSKFYVGVGNHDNESLVGQALDTKKRELHLKGIKQNYNTDISGVKYKSDEYLNQSEDEKTKEDFRNAKFSEIFTTSKQFFTLPDMFGMKERINISGRASDENWRVRIPGNYENFYFSQLSKGYGLNVPKALENAFYMRHLDNPELTEKLAQAAEILRQNGPLTEQEANEADKNGTLTNKFEFTI